MCGWQVKLCDPLVTHGPCLTSITAVMHDSLLGLSLLFCVVAEQFVLTQLKAAYYYCYQLFMSCLKPSQWVYYSNNILLCKTATDIFDARPGTHWWKSFL